MKDRLSKREINLLKKEIARLKEDVYVSEIKQKEPYINGEFKAFNAVEHLLTHLNIISKYIQDLLPEITEDYIVDELNKLENTHYWKYGDGEFFLINGNYKHENGDDIVEHRISTYSLDLGKIPLEISYKILLFYMFTYEEKQENEGYYNMKWFKKPIEVKFSVYETDGVESTREGSAPYEKGDYRMVGVEGEVWPMKPSVFEKNYEIAEGGYACKKKVLVDVIFAEEETEVETSWGAVLTAQPGDAIVSASADDRWVVTRSIFDETYLPEDEEIV